MTEKKIDSEKQQPQKEKKGQSDGNGHWGESLLIACSMYSRIPMPQTLWTEGGMRHAMCFFPLIGVMIGAVMCGFWYLADILQLGVIARSCIGTAIPLLITGGIHMDGFLDTVDALSSFQPREKKLEIMKDPHAGAFAIIGCGVYLLLYVAAFSELGDRAFPAGAGIYVLARAASGWSVVTLPKAKKDGLVTTFSSQADHGSVQGFMAVYLLGSAAWLWFWAGALSAGILLASALLCVCWYIYMTRKEFGGITGDLAGCFLQVCELVMLGTLAVLF